MRCHGHNDMETKCCWSYGNQNIKSCMHVSRTVANIRVAMLMALPSS